MVGIQSKFIHTHDIVLSVVSQCSSQWPGDPQEVSFQLQSDLQQAPGEQTWILQALSCWRFVRLTADLWTVCPCIQPCNVFSWAALLTAAGPTWKEAIASKQLTAKSSWQCPKTSSWPKALGRLQHSWVARAAWSRDHPSIHHCFWELWPGVANNKNTRFD